MVSDTVAKLHYEWSRPDRPPGDLWQLGPHATVVVDEAGMLGTHDLHRLMQLARQNMCGSCSSLTRTNFKPSDGVACSRSCARPAARLSSNASTASSTRGKQLRRCNYDTATPGRSTPTKPTAGSCPAASKTTSRRSRCIGSSAATTGSRWRSRPTRNEHVDLINDRIQSKRWERGDLDRSRRADTADGIGAWVGDLIATRRNDRTLITSAGQFVRNRDQWIVTAIDGHGDITAARIDGGGVVVLPAEYARDHVRLGYAATEPGNQSDTQDRSITLATDSTTGRGLYVGMTRGRQANHALVVTDTNDLSAARALLEQVVTCDRADVPAVSRREQLMGHVSSERSAEALRQHLESADKHTQRRHEVPESRSTDLSI